MSMLKICSLLTQNLGCVLYTSASCTVSGRRHWRSLVWSLPYLHCPHQPARAGPRLRGMGFVFVHNARTLDWAHNTVLNVRLFWECEGMRSLGACWTSSMNSEAREKHKFSVGRSKKFHFHYLVKGIRRWHPGSLTCCCICPATVLGSCEQYTPWTSIGCPEGWKFCFHTSGVTFWVFLGYQFQWISHFDCQKQFIDQFLFLFQSVRCWGRIATLKG